MTISTTSRVAQRAAGDERVVNVLLEAVVRVHHAGDAALGIAAVRLLDRILRDHQHAQPRIDRIRRPQPRQPAADDQHIGEEVRQLAGVERDEVAGGEHDAECGVTRMRSGIAALRVCELLAHL